jgi:hypothetical protein
MSAAIETGCANKENYVISLGANAKFIQEEVTWLEARMKRPF